MKPFPLVLFALVGCGSSPREDTGDPVRFAQASPRPTRFVFPLEQPELFYQVVGVDHDPEVHPPGIESGLCQDYEGRAFPWCYDEHDGTDFLLDGGFETMDAGSVRILAAADGVVVEVVDGNYDRCHAEVDGVNCDGYPMVANRVHVEHADGTFSHYLHMKNGSVAVEVGDQVACGDVLGRVGSSGNSSMPHLHFEVQTPEGEVVDPYAGPYSQEESWWVDQGSIHGLPAGVCP